MVYIAPIACWGFDETMAESYHSGGGNRADGRYSGYSRMTSGAGQSFHTVMNNLQDLDISGGILGAALYMQSGSPSGYLLSFNGNGGAANTLSINFSGGSARVYVGGTLVATSVSMSEAMPISNTWFHVELRFLFGSQGLVQLRLNGQMVAEAFDINIPITVLSHVVLRNPGNPIYQRIDDVYLVKDDTGVTADWLGDLRVITQLPGGNGSVNEWIGSDGNSDDNYLLVDEVNTSTADYVMTTETGKRDLYTPVPLEGPWEVLGTTIEVAGRKNVSGNAPNLKVVEKYGANEHVSDERPPNNATWARLGARMRTEAPDGLGWSVAKLNDTEFGIESS